MNYMDFCPYLAQERYQQMLGEVNSPRLEKRLPDDRGSSGSRFFAVGGSPSRIVVADDHPLIRHALTTTIDEQPDLEAIAEATDGFEAVELCRQFQPELVLMDVRMPGMDGLDEIPPGATHLFLGVWDSYYRDNCGTGATFVTETAGPPPDTTPPTLDLPDDKTVEAAGPNGVEVTYNATATDQQNCSLSPNCSVQDAAGNEATGSFVVSVVDTSAPSLTVPSNSIVVEATGPDGAAVDFADEVSAGGAVGAYPPLGACVSFLP